MPVFKCKMCGGTLKVDENCSTAVCEYCGSEQTVSKTEDEVIANLYNRANNLRLKSEFDKAEQIYEKIVESNDSEAEAHWGIVLCKYGIEYVEDPTTHKRIPTCHRSSYSSITTDPDYQAAVDYSDSFQQTIYEREARLIDKIQKDTLSIVKNEKPFDVFICYKETDENGQRTKDSVIANDIYYELTEAGFKVFYAAITLEDKLGQEYEPYIFAALNSAKVMLVVGSKPEYFSAVWVKNEWSRFLQLMKVDRSKLLIPCYKDMDAYDLPEEFSHLQALDMSKIGFINDVVRGIKKLISTSKAEQKEVKEVIVKSSTNNTNIEPLLERMFLFLEDGKWQDADIYAEKILDINPKNVEAYLGKLMAELNAKTRKELGELEEPFDNRENYNKVLRFGDEKIEKEIREYIDQINSRKEEKRLYEIYNNAISNMQCGTIPGYEKAIQGFKTLSGWEDSNEKIDLCNEKINLCNEKIQELKKKEERKAAKFFSLIAFVCIVLIVLIVLIGFLNTEIELNDKYNEAMMLIDSGDYDSAYMLLKDLSYKDSSEKASECTLLKQKKNLKENLVDVSVGDIINFGVYEQNNNTSNGKEEIKWIVLAIENNKALIISKYALENQKFNTSDTNVTWESCTLRSWLNETFINEAFDSILQEKIETTNISADNNPDYETDPGNNTTDKVFLLSIAEAKEYFSSYVDSNCYVTGYAAAQFSWSGTCNWWLRSPGCDQSSAAYVGGGLEQIVDNTGCSVNLNSLFVRPAMWINLE